MHEEPAWTLLQEKVQVGLHHAGCQMSACNLVSGLWNWASTRPESMFHVALNLRSSVFMVLGTSFGTVHLSELS